MLLVDNDYAEIGNRCENRRLRAYDDVSLPRSDPPPLVKTLARGQLAVKDGDPTGKPTRKALNRLGRQRDFRNQDNCPLSPGDNRCDQSQVNLGLAASGDAVKQKRMITGLGERLTYF